MGAPNVVRGGSHTGWHGAEDLVKMGCCSVICSDYHYPSLLHAVYRLARNESTSFDECRGAGHEKCCAHGQAGRSRELGIGQRGDVVLVEPGPLPRIVATIASGKLAYVAPDALERIKAK